MNNITEPNLGNLNGNENSGGLSRWVVYAIIAVVAVIIIVAAVIYTRKKIQESREDGSIIKDVGGAITDEVSKKVADDMLEVAIRAQTESAQLNADMETAKQLFGVDNALIFFKSDSDTTEFNVGLTSSNKGSVQYKCSNIKLDFNNS